MNKETCMMILSFILPLVIIVFFLIDFKYFFIMGDIPLHISIANEIKNNGIPPVNPCAPNFILHYQWIYHLFLSFITSVLPIDTILGIKIYSIILFSIFYWLTFYLGNIYFKNKIKAITFTLIISLFFLDWYYAPRTQSLGLIFDSLFFIFAFKFIRTRKIKFLISSSIITVVTIYIHGISFVFLILATLSIFIFILFNTNSIRKKLFLITIGIIPFVLLIPYYLLFLEKIGEPLFIILPFFGLYLIFTDFNSFLPKLIILAFVPFVLKKLKKPEENYNKILFFILLIFSTIFSFSHSFDIIRYIFFMIFPATFISLNYIFSNKYKKVILFVIILLLLLPMDLDDVVNFNKINKIEDSPEFKASIFLKQNTNKDDVIVSSPSAIYLVLSERNQIVCEPYLISGMLFNITDRERDLSSFFYMPSQEVAKRYNVKYVIFGNMERNFVEYLKFEPYNFSNSDAFEKIYNDKIEIFYLKNITKLNETYDKNLIHSKLMEKLHYRLWYNKIQNIVMERYKNVFK